MAQCSMRRGGQPDGEIAHGKLLIEGGAEDIWGWNTPAGKQRVEARVRWLTKSCDLRPGRTALECGCGTGMFSRQLAKTGVDLTSADISQDLLDEARRYCPDDNATFTLCNLEQPDELPDAHFDAMLGVSVLHHLEMAKALPALRKKLKPGAQIAFSEPNLCNPINKYVMFTDDQEKRRKLGVSPAEMAFYPGELREAFEAAGFRVLSLAHRDFLHPKTPKAMIALVKGGQYVAERLPLVRRWSGSLWIHAENPA